VFGTGDLTSLPLEGKWMGEVLVYARHAERDGGFRNGLAGHLTLHALGNTHVIFGPVLMTLVELLDDPPVERRRTLGELLEWARPRG